MGRRLGVGDGKSDDGPTRCPHQHVRLGQSGDAWWVGSRAGFAVQSNRAGRGRVCRQPRHGLVAALQQHRRGVAVRRGLCPA
jgi:hypothetical protein